MYINDYYHKFNNWRQKIFNLRFEMNFLEKLTGAVFVALITGILAQFRFYLPFTPVPLTGQVFAVLVSALFLGKWWGGASQGIYVGAGAFGMPWFQGFTSGFGVITGVTGGYLLGFIAAALFIGHVIDNYQATRNFIGLLLVLMSGVGIIYLFGSIQFALVWGLTLEEVIWMGVLPFILIDLMKALAACWVGLAFIPSKALPSFRF